MKINFVFLFLGVVLCNSISYSQIISTTKHFSTDGMDALVISGANAGNNFGTASNFGIEQPVTRRAYLYMDFSDIPTDAIVLSATLNLHSYSVVNHPTLKGYITQLKGTANWNESITWNTQPAYTEFLSGSEQMINSELSTVGLQEYDITTDVQNMVNHPTLNKGWVLRLQHESGANRRTYWYSREHSNAAERPTITLEYILPIEISGTVNHANEGLTDGEITPTVIQGSGTYTDYTWYKLTGGPATIVETGFNISNAAVSNLSDGLYLLKVKDDLDNIGYNYFLVGEYGATTTVDFRWYGSLSNSSAFNEDATVKYDVVDNDGNSVGGNNSSYLLYQNASQYNSTLLKYKVTIDPEFVIENATLNLFGYGHYSNNSDPNDAYASIITQQWYENIVTWNTRPSITVTDQIIIPATPAGAMNFQRDESLDIKDFVIYWQLNPGMNFGIDLRLQNYSPVSSFLRYRSSDYSTSRPQFLLTYTLPKPVNVFFTPAREIKGGYYLVPIDDTLRFEFYEEYTSGQNLSYDVIDNQGNAVSGLTTLIEIFGDNRFKLNVASLNPGYYLLEIQNDKKEKWYLRFKTQ